MKSIIVRQIVTVADESACAARISDLDAPRVRLSNRFTIGPKRLSSYFLSAEVINIVPITEEYGTESVVLVIPNCASRGTIRSRFLANLMKKLSAANVTH